MMPLKSSHKTTKAPEINRGTIFLWSVNALKYPEIRSNIVATHNILHTPQRSEQPRKYNKKASKQAVNGLITDFSLGSPNWARTSDIMINSHAVYFKKVSVYRNFRTFRMLSVVNL